MQHSFRPWRAALVGSLAVGLVFSLNGIGLAGTPHGPHGAGARQQARNAYVRAHGGAPTATHTPNDGDLADQLAQYDAERTAPAGSLSGQALVSAQQQAAALPVTGSTWQEFTNEPYNAQPSNYTDPFWGNEGAGFSLVGGRVTALATTPDGDWFAGDGRRRRVEVNRPGPDLDAGVRLDADTVHRGAGGRSGRRVAVGRHRRGQHLAGLLRRHGRVPVDQRRRDLPAGGRRLLGQQPAGVAHGIQDRVRLKR